MAEPKNASVQEGTFLITVGFLGAWKVEAAVCLAEVELGDGIVRIFCDPSGAIRVRIFDSSGNSVLDQLSCPLEMALPMMATIGFSWSLPKGHWIVVMNGVRIGHSNSSTVPNRARIEPRKQRTIPENYAQLNQNAIERRRDKLNAWKTKPGRIKSDFSEIRAALEDELAQIEDLLDHIRNEKLHHIKGLSSRLRMLIATGSPLPLLQLYAAQNSLPIIVFVDEVPAAEGDFKFEPSIQFSGATISEKIVKDFQIPIDLDIWLESFWGKFDGKIFSNRNVIKSIGDTIGSHFDQDTLPITLKMRSTKSELHGVSADIIVMYIGHISLIVSKVGRSLLEK